MFKGSFLKSFSKFLKFFILHNLPDPYLYLLINSRSLFIIILLFSWVTCAAKGAQTQVGEFTAREFGIKIVF